MIISQNKNNWEIVRDLTEFIRYREYNQKRF